MRRPRRPADGAQLAGVKTHRVAHRVQSDGVRKLRVQERHHVALRTERTGLFVYAMLAGRFRRQVAGNVCANLTQCAKLPAG